MLGCLVLVLYLPQGVAFAITASRLIRRSPSRVFASVFRQDISFFDSNKDASCALVSFVTTDIQAIVGISVATQGAVVNFVFTLLASIVKACPFGWKLALMCISTMPLLLFRGFIRTWILTRLEHQARQGTTASALACEAINAIRTVAALTIIPVISKILVKQEHRNRSISWISFSRPSSTCFRNVCHCLQWAWRLVRWNLDRARRIHVFICFVSVIRGSQAAAGIFSFAEEIGSARQATERLQELLS